MSTSPYKTEEEVRFRALEVEGSSVQASQITVLTASTAANASAIVVLEAALASNAPLILDNASAVTVLEALRDSADINYFVSGSVAAASTVLGVYVAARALTLPTQNALTGYATITGSGINSFNIKHTGAASALSTASVIGTVAWGSAQTSGSVDLAASVTVALGDALVLVGDNLTVSSIADFGFTIQGRSTA